MNKKLFLLLFLVMMVTVAGCSNRKPGENKQPPEPPQQNVMKPGDFQDPASCGACHKDIHTAWSGSMHAAAWVNDIYQPDYLQAFEESLGATDIFCGECHAPIAVRVGQLPPADGSAFDDISKKGVSCDFCHTIAEVREPFNVQSTSDPGPLKRGPHADASSPSHQTQFSELFKDARFCGACHNVRHPQSGAVVIDTYDDWLAGPYAKDGITCQDCHMTPTPGVSKNPGVSAKIGGAKEREHIATHYFVGGSSWMLARMGQEEHAQMAEENLRAAASLEVTGKTTTDGLELHVTVHNTGAGHSIPTGVTYIRQMWLEVTVTNQKGEIVFLSGHPDNDNHIDPQAVFFGKIFSDKDGNPTTKSWLAEGIVYDRRIPPKGSSSETYTIKAPAAAYSATVRLLYRSTTQAAVSQHFPDDLKIPSVEMAAATVEIR